MDPIIIIIKHFKPGTKAFDYFMAHSEAVAHKCLEIAQKHPELKLDKEFLWEAAMLHDIGICKVHAPEIGFHGKENYMKHGILGREILEKEGFPKHALVCERHTGAGLRMVDIAEQELPLPPRDMVPMTNEEKVIAYADKFFSKSDKHNLKQPKSTIQIVKELRRFGEHKVKIFKEWHRIYG